jgi:hypothetical protein
MAISPHPKRAHAAGQDLTISVKTSMRTEQNLNLIGKERSGAVGWPLLPNRRLNPPGDF